MDPVAVRVGLLTVGVAVFFVGLGILIVGALGSSAGPLLGLDPGIPQAALGAGLMAVGYAAGSAAWDLAAVPEEE